MKVTVKAWPDTKCVDLIFEPETDGEAALLVLLSSRKPHWNMSRTDGKGELICPFAPVGS